MTTDPTIEQMRIEVLKWMGWTEIRPSANAQVSELCGYPPGRNEWPPENLPDLTLDWWHSCWMKLTDLEKQLCVEHLCGILGIEDDYLGVEQIVKLEDATAEQRLTALYKTIKTP